MTKAAIQTAPQQQVPTDLPDTALEQTGPPWWLTLLGALVIIVAVLAVYSPLYPRYAESIPESQKVQFQWDDAEWLENSPVDIRSNEVWKYWNPPKGLPMLDYWPLTASTFWLQWRLWYDEDTEYNDYTQKKAQTQTSRFGQSCSFHIPGQIAPQAARQQQGE